MSEKILLIKKEDVNDNGVFYDDLSCWNDGIVIENMTMIAFDRNANCTNFISKSETTIVKSLICRQFRAINAHVLGDLKCSGDLKAKDILIDGNCVVEGNVVCDNISVLGFLIVNGNIKSNGDIRLFSGSSIKGIDNYAYGKRLNKTLPFLLIDQSTSGIEKIDYDEFTKGKVETMFFDNGDALVELNGKTPMKLEYFSREFGCGYPFMAKYLNEVKNKLSGAKNGKN